MEALAAVTLPQVLQTAYAALTVAWKQYQVVEEQKSQCNVLLSRCNSLVLEVSIQIRCGSDNSLSENIHVLESACLKVMKTMESLALKGFAWRLFHQSDLKTAIATAEHAVADACTVFNINAQLTAHDLQVQMAAARENDQRVLVERLDRLAENDENILKALQDGDNQYRRLEELLMAFMKRHHRTVDSQEDPIQTFINRATNSLQRLSHKSDALDVPHWSLTSLEVTIDRDAFLGRGAFGSIYQGDWGGQVVAVKEMHKEEARLLDRQQMKPIRDEIAIWCRLAHPHVLPFYGACLESEQPFIVSKFCPNGNAIQFLRKFPQADRICMLHEIALGMNYLHGLRIVHADIKAVNVLVGDDGKALVADFGLSRARDQLSTMMSKRTSSYIEGTLRWMAPERLDGSPLELPCDVYSYAITAWELYTGEVPFTDIPDRVLPRVVVDRQRRPSRPAPLINDSLWSLIETCWHPESSKRPTFSIIHAKIKPLIDHTNSSLQNNNNNQEKSSSSTTNVASANVQRTPPTKARVGMDTLRATHKYAVDLLDRIETSTHGSDDVEDAVKLLRQVLEGTEKELGPDHLDTLKVAYDLARAYNEKKQYKKAEELYNRVLAGREKQLGERHLEVLSAKYGVARACCGQMRYDEAKVLFKQVLAGRKKHLGPDHLRTFDAMAGLGDTWTAEGKCKKAKLTYKRVLAGKEKQLGVEHPETLNAAHGLAQAYLGQSRYKDSEALHKRLLACREKVLGEEHPTTLNAVTSLAETYDGQKRYDEADRLYRRVLATRERTLGAEHLDTLDAVYTIAEAYHRRQWHKEAEEISGKLGETVRRLRRENK